MKTLRESILSKDYKGTENIIQPILGQLTPEELICSVEYSDMLDDLLQGRDAEYLKDTMVKLLKGCEAKSCEVGDAPEWEWQAALNLAGKIAKPSEVKSAVKDLVDNYIENGWSISSHLKCWRKPSDKIYRYSKAFITYANEDSFGWMAIPNTMSQTDFNILKSLINPNMIKESILSQDFDGVDITDVLTCYQFLSMASSVAHNGHYDPKIAPWASKYIRDLFKSWKSRNYFSHIGSFEFTYPSDVEVARQLGNGFHKVERVKRVLENVARQYQPDDWRNYIFDQWDNRDSLVWSRVSAVVTYINEPSEIWGVIYIPSGVSKEQLDTLKTMVKV